MVSPYYIRNVYDFLSLDVVSSHVQWLSVTDARHECFMSHSYETYTYDSGRGVRTYTPVPYTDIVKDIEFSLNYSSVVREGFGGYLPPNKFNVCFLNRYDSDKHQLGWHSDDSPGMDHDHPIVVVSFGAAREIWWREKDEKGAVRDDQRQLLEHGSVFVMPPGMQRTHVHRIPKSDRKDIGVRVSLTYRHYDPVN